MMGPLFLFLQAPAVDLTSQKSVTAGGHVQIAVDHIERSSMRRIDPSVFRPAVGFVVDFALNRDPGVGHREFHGEETFRKEIFRVDTATDQSEQIGVRINV